MTRRVSPGGRPSASVTAAFYRAWMLRLVSWNVNKLAPWGPLGTSGADVALLQELAAPGADCPVEVLPGGDETWAVAGWERRPWRTAIARLTDRVSVDPVISAEMSGADPGALPISRAGTITACRVGVGGAQVLTAVSVYSPWERYLGRESPLWADGSAHRILSDLSPLLWNQRREPVLVAGDWNILRGYGEHGDADARRRYATVFERAEALGLVFLGPEYPNGRRASPHPAELPEDNMCVPTFHHSRQRPETAARQLDFVFGSKSIAERITVRALNEPGQWGPSDHCQVQIDVET